MTALPVIAAGNPASGPSASAASGPPGEAEISAGSSAGRDAGAIDGKSRRLELDLGSREPRGETARLDAAQLDAAQLEELPVDGSKLAGPPVGPSASRAAEEAPVAPPRAPRGSGHPEAPPATLAPGGARDAEAGRASSLEGATSQPSANGDVAVIPGSTIPEPPLEAPLASGSTRAADAAASHPESDGSADSTQGGSAARKGVLVPTPQVAARERGPSTSPTKSTPSAVADRLGRGTTPPVAEEPSEEPAERLAAARLRDAVVPPGLEADHESGGPRTTASRRTAEGTTTAGDASPASLDEGAPADVQRLAPRPEAPAARTTPAITHPTALAAPAAHGAARQVGGARQGRAEAIERQLEVLVRARRQDAATSAVNRMTLRQAAEGRLDLGDLGSVTVTARTLAGEVDVAVRAEQRDTAAILQSASGLLEAELRRDAVDLRHLDVEHDSEERRGGSRRHSEGDAPDRRAPEPEPDDMAAFEAVPGSVRFVL